MGLFDTDTGFDRATLELAPGNVRELTRREFDALPLGDRVRAILSKRLRFYRGKTELTFKEALGDRY